MNRKLLSVSTAALLLGITLAPAILAEEKEIYGREMMTQEERFEYQKRMRIAESEEAREKIRAEHHDRMKQRAAERGLKMPDSPPRAGMDMGRNDSSSRGTGFGSGSGSGRGRDR